jgi:Ferritin-like
MLRIETRQTGPTARANGDDRLAATGVEIIRDFRDPLLELVRLLREASEIEHALLVQYLYGAFSVKPIYPQVIGFGSANARDLLGVAIQEMKHLHEVNGLLVTIGAAPNLVRQDFPYEPDIYPFPLNLEPLSPTALAKYTYTEASSTALDPDHATDVGDKEFLDRLFGILGDVRPNHLGSLYEKIIEVTDEVIAAGIPGLPDLSGWPTRLEQIQSQGEDAHFRFFRNVFMGTHPGFGGHADVWALPADDPAYPAFRLPVNPSAFKGHPGQISDSRLRDIAWLGDLHYWLVLLLLDLGYRTGDPTPTGLSKDHMRGPLLQLGRNLAGKGEGLPFDPLSMGYAPGMDVQASTRFVRRLVVEAQAVTEKVKDLLPPTFSFGQNQQTLDALDAFAPMAQTLRPRTPGTPAAQPQQAPAMQFWYELDDRFFFNPPPEILQAYAALGDLDFILGRYKERRRTGTYPNGFIQDVMPLREGLAVISGGQLEIVDKNLGTDFEAARRAFEDFGQGILFDDRRPPGNKVHMMDSSGLANPPIGYHRWHAIIRAMVLLEIDATRWTELDRLVGLAWAIHAKAIPIQDTHNPPLPEATLTALRARWLAHTQDKLDTAFDSSPFPAE